MFYKCYRCYTCLHINCRDEIFYYLLICNNVEKLKCMSRKKEESENVKIIILIL